MTRLVLCSLLFLFCPPVAKGEELQTKYKILSLDFAQVLSGSRVVQRIQEQIRNHTTFCQHKFSEQSENLRKKHEKLIKCKANKKNNKQLKKEKEKLETLVSHLQDEVDRTGKQVNKVLRKSMLFIQKEVSKIAEEICTEFKASLVLHKNVIVFATANIHDITDELIARLDDKLKNFNISFAPKNKKVKQ